MTMQIEKPKKKPVVISNVATAALRTPRCVKMNLEELVKMYESHPEKLEALMRMKI